MTDSLTGLQRYDWQRYQAVLRCQPRRHANRPAPLNARCVSDSVNYSNQPTKRNLGSDGSSLQRECRRPLAASRRGIATTRHRRVTTSTSSTGTGLQPEPADDGIADRVRVRSTRWPACPQALAWCSRRRAATRFEVYHRLQLPMALRDAVCEQNVSLALAALPDSERSR